MRKGIALLLVLILLCSSCSILKEKKSEQKISLLPPKIQSTQYLTVYPTLYYVDYTTGKIMTTSTKLQVQDWKQSPLLIIQSLLASQLDLGFGYIGNKIHVIKIELTNEIANVYLEANFFLTEQQRYILSILIANTMIENYDVSYVNVEVSGKLSTIAQSVVGLFEKTEGNVLELYQQKAEDAELLQKKEYNANIGLYFIEGKSGYLLPEVRSVNIADQSQTSLIVNVLCELAQGPIYETDCKSPLQEPIFSQVLLKSNEEEIEKFLSYENGVLEILQADLLFASHEQEERGRYLASIYYTIKGILPGLITIRSYWQDGLMTVTQEEAQKYLGDYIEIYLPNEDMVSIQKVKRVVHTDQRLDWNTYIRLIGEGPISSDPQSVVSAFPGGLSEEDLLSLEVSEDCAILNFSQDFIYGLERLTAQGQILMIYSIVNTICNIGPINSVQFLVNGEYIDSIKGGKLSLISPLLSNPGLVKQ